MASLMSQNQHNQVLLAQQGSYTEESAQWISHELYDTLTIPSTATTMNFFQTPVSGTKSFAKTNMKQSGQLPVNQKFRFFQVEISALLKPTGSLADHDLAAEAFLEVIQNSWFQFVIDGREYDLQFNGASLLPTLGYVGALSSAVSAGRFTSKGTYRLGAKINLGALTSFGLNVNFDPGANVVTQLGVLSTKTTELQVRLAGELFRKIA